MEIDRPGFADPVPDAQGAFRAVLDALAHPGRVVAVGDALDPPAPLSKAAGGVLLALADAETAVCLPAGEAARAWIGFHAGSPMADAAAAAFVLAGELPPLAALRPGTDEEPETGATLILEVAALTGGPALRLTGPGIETQARIAPMLPAQFPAWWRANHARFPRGVDLVLCNGSALMALPRSIAVEAL